MDVELIIANMCTVYLSGLESDSVVGDYKQGHLPQISTNHDSCLNIRDILLASRKGLCSVYYAVACVHVPLLNTIWSNISFLHKQPDALVIKTYSRKLLMMGREARKM
jgi:hypothetical protein